MGEGGDGSSVNPAASSRRWANDDGDNSGIVEDDDKDDGVHESDVSEDVLTPVLRWPNLAVS